MKRIKLILLSIFMVSAMAGYAQSDTIDITDKFDKRFLEVLIEKGVLKDKNIVRIADVDTITILDLHRSRLTSLAGIEYFTALLELECGVNELTNLDLSKNTELRGLYCMLNFLSHLDVSKNIKLEKLFCSHNQLTLLDVSKNTELKELYCCDNQLTHLDMSKNIDLEKLDCSWNRITNLDLKKNTKLRSIKK